MSLRGGEFRLGFIVSANFLVMIYKSRNFFSGKTHGFFTFVNFSFHFPFGGLLVFIFPLQMLFEAILGTLKYFRRLEGGDIARSK